MTGINKHISPQPRFWPETFEVTCIHCGPVKVDKKESHYHWYHILAAYHGSRISPTTCPQCAEEVMLEDIVFYH